MLLDTSGLLCYHHRDEPKHSEARTLFRQARRALTHSYVLSEFIALANARKLPRPLALTFLTTLGAHRKVEMVWVDKTLHDRAMALLAARLDKTYSLCDAVSFVLMKEQGITDALTTDHHFEQEGFKRLL
ncbi:MAG: type II toxin-antitoxin system VapC family toxin [Pyrinomonadaceae bacterium]|nr:type II toxin-antitoxin system VapC family toxin [Pyrinomonadaceae bacterium]